MPIALISADPWHSSATAPNRLDIGELRYPRTKHLEGSRLPPGMENTDETPWSELAGRHIVVEEKLDGAHAVLCFDAAGDLRLQSRNSHLVDPIRERQFTLYQRWAQSHADPLLQRIEDRYVICGEWLYKKHTLYYDQLPHYYCEFDIYDRARGIYLSTPERHALLAPLPLLSVPVLYAGPAPGRIEDLLSLLGPSLARSKHWRSAFERAVKREGISLDRALRQCDHSDQAEGLYIKLEDDQRTIARYKWVRHDFVQAILESAQHHAAQPFIPNALADGVDIYATTLTHQWPEIPQ